MIRAVIFDMGGVIVDLNMDRCVRNFKELGFGNIEEYLDCFHQRGFFRDLETGAITEDEFCHELQKLSYPGTTRESLFEAFSSFLDGVQPYKLEFIKELGKKYPLYVLSNNNPIVVRDFDRVCSKYGVTFAKSFVKCYFSYQLKLVKPDPEFYRHVIRDIGLPAEELLFIDDNQTNVDIARAEGMTAVWYDVSTNLGDCVMNALK